MKIHKLIRIWFIIKDIDQVGFAKKIGISVTYLSDILRNDQKELPDKFKIGFHGVFGFPVDELPRKAKDTLFEIKTLETREEYDKKAISESSVIYKTPEEDEYTDKLLKILRTDNEPIKKLIKSNIDILGDLKCCCEWNGEERRKALVLRPGLTENRKKRHVYG